MKTVITTGREWEIHIGAKDRIGANYGRKEIGEEARRKTEEGVTLT